jgi:hypothetical protein
MDIYTLKIKLEGKVRPAPLQSLVSVELAWGYFKQFIRNDLDEDHCEEFGFSVSEVVHGEDILFQIYFGRLIDAVKEHPWRTAEINFYFEYGINSELRLLLMEYPQCDIETAYCTSEEKKVIGQKIDAVIAFADEKQRIWDAVRNLTPVNSSYHFWIQ